MVGKNRHLNLIVIELNPEVGFIHFRRSISSTLKINPIENFPHEIRFFCLVTGKSGLYSVRTREDILVHHVVCSQRGGQGQNVELHAHSLEPRYNSSEFMVICLAHRTMVVNHFKQIPTPERRHSAHTFWVSRLFRTFKKIPL